MAITFLISIFLLVVIYQDFRYLSISWWVFPCLFILAAIQGVQQIGLLQLASMAGINLLFIGLLVLMLTLYFSIKEKKLVNLTNNYLGFGDILFFIFLALSFDPLVFFIFFITSTLIILFFFLLIKLLKFYKTNRVPLAGAMSIVYLLFLLMSFQLGYNNYEGSFIPQHFLNFYF